jgi:hypothetical protein
MSLIWFSNVLKNVACYLLAWHISWLMYQLIKHQRVPLSIQAHSSCYFWFLFLYKISLSTFFIIVVYKPSTTYSLVNYYHLLWLVCFFLPDLRRMHICFGHSVVKSNVILPFAQANALSEMTEKQPEARNDTTHFSNSNQAVWS